MCIVSLFLFLFAVNIPFFLCVKNLALHFNVWFPSCLAAGHHVQAHGVPDEFLMGTIKDSVPCSNQKFWNADNPSNCPVVATVDVWWNQKSSLQSKMTLAVGPKQNKTIQNKKIQWYNTVHAVPSLSAVQNNNGPSCRKDPEGWEGIKAARCQFVFDCSKRTRLPPGSTAAGTHYIHYTQHHQRTFLRGPPLKAHRHWPRNADFQGWCLPRHRAASFWGESITGSAGVASIRRAPATQLDPARTCVQAARLLSFLGDCRGVRAAWRRESDLRAWGEEPIMACLPKQSAACRVTALFLTVF